MLASSKSGYSVPTRVIPPGYNPAGGTEFPVRASLGFASGDLALAASNATNPCWVFQVTAAPPSTGRTLPRANDAPRWNPANTPDVAYGDGAVLMNLGSLVDNIYEIDNTNNRKVLRISSFNAASPATRTDRDVQSDIVELRAFYGRDTSVPPDGVVDVYDVPSVATQAAYTNADWLRVVSVRVIIVSRSSTWEKREERADGTFWYPTPANPEWSVGTVPAVSGAAACSSGTGECITLDVGAGVAGDVEAKHHRYKIFDTVIPLRNMLWSAS
jgi:type IV pilus assembly protein PilW